MKRKPGEPGEPEPEHPEQHARSDRPRGRLAHVGDAVACVERECDEQRELSEPPVEVEEALVALRLGDEVGAEDTLDVDRGQGEIPWDRGRPEEGGAGGEADESGCGAQDGP
jgi:hypothetical protein